MAERFDLYIQKGEPDECWPWVGGCDPDGYGIYWSSGLKRKVRAHRFAFYLTYGWWPVFVCHTCDNPPCCNPACLFAGDAQTNHDDIAAKGRRPSRRVNAKLTEERVRRIRAQYASGGESHRTLALQYDVSSGCIQQLLQRRTWKTVA